MASLIPDYEYDIFISYRQKDNKGDAWVTEFVNALKTELESTFKEDVSVYFDINPHDGLLETHDVDASLKEKLRCLIFIPIISRTYCDPKSFAWEHEFKAFVELASQDQFGLKVKLPGGNVASRILPVQIHELDSDDRKLVENELGGFLRGIEFIYRESGVNRSLLPNDHEEKNLNNTTYRNQINKVALAIKEIITAIRHFSPEQEEVQKGITKPAPVLAKNRKTTIIAGSFITLALIILGFFFIPKLFKPSEQLEKSIAVLPFINDSPDQENTYFINGIMDEVLNNLQKIKDFRVLSRTSTEQYRGSTRPSIPKIGKALDVNYIVEGSGQKYGNTFRLRVQLIAADNERHLWAESYEQEINDTKDIFKIQSEIAKTIAHELKATITPKEKQLIEKTPTKDLTAYDFYQRGREEEGTYSLFNQYTTTSLNKTTLEKVEKMYVSALKCDSTFALAYLGLATLYWNKHYFEEYFSKEFLDSVLILTNIALSYDDQLAEAYYLRGRYYAERGVVEQALKEYDNAIKLNPNDWKSYYGKEQIYIWEDSPKALENLQKAVFLNHSSELPGLLREISNLLVGYGFFEQAKIYNLSALKLDDDSIRYYLTLETIEFLNANYIGAIELLKKGYSLDSTNLLIIGDLAYCYGSNRQFKESLKFYKIYIERRNALGQFDLQTAHRIGYAFWENGYRKEAEYYFDKQIEYCNEQISLERPLASQLLYVYYDLAAVYAFRGDKDKAYKNLKIFNQMQRIPIGFVPIFRNDPLFGNIRNEEEFQKIVGEVELKGQAEYERLKKWLEEQGIL